MPFFRSQDKWILASACVTFKPINCDVVKLRLRTFYFEGFTSIPTALTANDSYLEKFVGITYLPYLLIYNF